MARRGRPLSIRSDNGTNFVGAQRELKKLVGAWDDSTVKNALRREGIDWKFNPPFASHMGGCWERQIRTVRSKLAVLTSEQVLTDESLQTVLTIAEGMVNNRPLTVVSDDARDGMPLTPNHLLLTRRSEVGRTADVGSAGLNSKRRWRQVLFLVGQFWSRWVKEYLSQLHQRSKWLYEKRNLKSGDAVLVHDALQPRDQWLIARVLDPLVGRDGKIRAAKVLTVKGQEIVRPITKLSLLEGIADEEEEALEVDERLQCEERHGP